MSDLQDILDDKEPEQPEVEAKAEAPEPEPAEKGDEAPEAKAEEAPEEVVPPTTEKMVPEAALLAERRKRQALEEQEQFWKDLKAQKESQPDPLEDPEGAYRSLQQTVDQRILNERLNMSEMMHRQSKGDQAVDAAVEAFGEAAKQTPAMQQQALQHRDPYGFVLKWHEQQTQIAEIGNLDDWKAKTREALKAELMAEMKADQPIQQPTDMSDVPSKPPGTRGYSGPTPLDDLLK